MRCYVLLVWLSASQIFGQSGSPPPYHALQQVNGLVRVSGSPQMAALLDFYERGFREKQPGVTFQNNLQSTLSAVSTVSEGRADISVLGREIWTEESNAFTSANGHPPLVVPVATGAFDVPKATFALMIFVSKTNPIASLTILQLERIFSDTANPVRTWGELGLKKQWAHQPIHLYGFTADNDKSRIFRDLVFTPGQHWSSALREFNNDSGGTDAGEKITRAIANDPDGIGISNVHYTNTGVRVVPIALRVGLAPVFPSRSSVAAHRYPLFRSVYVVIDQPPGRLPRPAVREFLRFMLSGEGAQAVSSEGNYLPFSALEASSASALVRSR